jgi:hypothetical protein
MTRALFSPISNQLFAKFALKSASALQRAARSSMPLKSSNATRRSLQITLKHLGLKPSIALHQLGCQHHVQVSFTFQDLF